MPSSVQAHELAYLLNDYAMQGGDDHWNDIIHGHGGVDCNWDATDDSIGVIILNEGAGAVFLDSDDTWREVPAAQIPWLLETDSAIAESVLQWVKNQRAKNPDLKPR